MTDRGQRVYFKSMSDDWETPQDLFDRLNARYHFDIDVCADEHNAKCERYFTKEQDGLRQEWSGRCWMNPPYGRGISSWMKKAYEASLNGATVVCLVPARTDTAWWHDWAVRGKVEFLRGRLKFGGQKNNAPFPSAIVLYGGDEEKKPTIDAEPLRRGRWDDKSIAFCNVCSECHTAVDRTACFPRISRKGIVQPIVGKLNYCPNCGAKMDAKEDV